MNISKILDIISSVLEDFFRGARNDVLILTNCRFEKSGMISRHFIRKSGFKAIVAVILLKYFFHCIRIVHS